MKHIIFLLLLLSLFNQCEAQLIKDWDHRFGGSSVDNFVKVIETTDHGFLLAGYSISDSSFDKSQNNWNEVNNYWIVKTDSAGIKVWDKRFGGLEGDVLSDVIQSSDGGFLLGGTTLSGIGGDHTDTSRGFDDYWIVKIDKDGNYEWDKTFGGSSDDGLASIIQTSDKGYLLGGYSYSDSSGDKSQNNWTGGYGHLDMWIIKVDSLGNKEWDKRFGGFENDACSIVYQTKDGGYLLGGGSSSDIGGDKTGDTWGFELSDYWIIKIDSTGNKLWDKDFGAESQENAYSLDVTKEGNIVLAGKSTSLPGGDKTVTNWGAYPDGDFWIVLMDSSGIKIWDQHFGGFDNDNLCKIKTTSDNGFLASGYSWSNIGGDKSESNGIDSNGASYVNAWMIKFDNSGNRQWDKTLINKGNNTGAGWALETYKGDYVIGTRSDGEIGYDKSENCRGASDYFFAKFHFEPINFLSDTTVCQKGCIDFTNSSYISSDSWLWLFPGGTPPSDTSKNPVVCYNTPGVFDVTLIGYHAGKNDTLIKTNYIKVYPTPAVPVIIQSNDSLICSNAFAYQWYFNQVIISGATNQTYVITQQGDYSVETKDENGCPSFSSNFQVGIIPISSDLLIQIFPNPADNMFTINFSSSNYSALQLEITNLLGQQLLKIEITNGKQFQIPISLFSDNQIIFCNFFNNIKLIGIRKILIAK